MGTTPFFFGQGRFVADKRLTKPHFYGNLCLYSDDRPDLVGKESPNVPSMKIEEQGSVPIPTSVGIRGSTTLLTKAKSGGNSRQPQGLRCEQRRPDPKELGKQIPHFWFNQKFA